MSFEPHRPHTVGEAVALVERYGPRANVLAGGTWAAILFGQRNWGPEHVILLDGVSELSGVTDQGDAIVVGATTTFDEVARSPMFASSLRAMTDAARVIGGPQIQNIGTVGGNIAAESPTSDLLPPLMALDAEVTLIGPAGERRRPIGAFLLGGGSIDIRADEIITSVRLPKSAGASASAYVKVGRRKAMEMAIVGVAARLTVDPDTGRCRDVRVAIGAVANEVYRAAAAERVLEGASPIGIVFDQAGHLAAEAANPISDFRASADYRRLLVEALVPRALRLCAERIDGARPS
jgi:aerobic carbon-monoxide dehydrogenase medium subunit